MDNIRKKNVESQLKREISDIIMRELKDPRVKLVSVNKVSLTNDLRIAHVYVSGIGADENKKKGSIIRLRNAAGFVRKEIGERVRLRYNPEIKFEIDESVEQIQRVEELLKTIEEEGQQDD